MAKKLYGKKGYGYFYIDDEIEEKDNVYIVSRLLRYRYGNFINIKDTERNKLASIVEEKTCGLVNNVYTRKYGTTTFSIVECKFYNFTDVYVFPVEVLGSNGEYRLLKDVPQFEFRLSHNADDWNMRLGYQLLEKLLKHYRYTTRR